MSKPLALLIVIVVLAAACSRGGSTATPPGSPSALAGGLTRGLIAYTTATGLGVLDPATGKSSIITAFPAGGLFRVSGPVWGPVAGTDHPVIYFTVHDDRPAETRDSAGVVPYDWLFRVDPFAGTIEPVSASQDSASEGPIGIAANGHYLAMTVGCCAAYEVDALDLTQESAPMTTLARPTDPVTFFTEGIAPGTSGLIAVRAFSTGSWYWLNADAHVLNPFPLKLGPDDGPIAVSPDGTIVAVALPTVGTLLEPISVAVPLVSPTPIPGITPSPSPTPESTAHATPSAPYRPRTLVSGIHPEALSWSPDATQVAVVANAELDLFDATPTGSSSPVKRYFRAAGIAGVAWSPPIPDHSLSMVKGSPAPLSTVDALIAATALPAAADTPNNRPFTKVYLWQFDSSKPSPVASITDATPAVLAKYAPLPAGVTIHHWAGLDSWELLGGCMRYRVVVTGSIPPVATTVGLTGSAPCLAPTPS